MVRIAVGGLGNQLQLGTIYRNDHRQLLKNSN